MGVGSSRCCSLTLLRQPGFHSVWNDHMHSPADEVFLHNLPQRLSFFHLHVCCLAAGSSRQSRAQPFHLFVAACRRTSVFEAAPAEKLVRQQDVIRRLRAAV